MTKLFGRLVFGLWIVGAPMLLVGCGEESKPAASPAAAAPGGAAPGGDAPKAK